MIIKSFRRTSLVDFPGNIVSTVFVAGCNFRCPFCHNPELVFDDPSLKAMPAEYVLKELERRKGLIDGVCVSGGEPTIHKDLPEFLAKIKSLGLKTKLDTNGSNPGMLRKIIHDKLADYVAMDIKSSFGNYLKATGSPPAKVLESAAMLIGGGVDYEFRSTAVPGLFSMNELKSICKEIAGAKRYIIQQFNANAELVDPGFSKIKPFTAKEIEGFASFAGRFVRECGIRNL